MSNKKKQTKKIKLIIILLILILIILLIMLIELNFIGKSKDVILDRLISGIDNLNYSYYNGEDKVQVVGKLEKKTTSDYTMYNNYENKQVQTLYYDSNYLDEYDNNGITDMDYYNLYIVPYFDNKDYNYKYIGKKDYNGNKYIVIRFMTDKKTEEIYIWIDPSTNIIKRIEKYKNQVILDKREKTFDEEYNFNTGENKLEDVQITEEELSQYSSETNG